MCNTHKCFQGISTLVGRICHLLCSRFPWGISTPSTITRVLAYNRLKSLGMCTFTNALDGQMFSSFQEQNMKFIQVTKILPTVNSDTLNQNASSWLGVWRRSLMRVRRSWFSNDIFWGVLQRYSR